MLHTTRFVFPLLLLLVSATSLAEAQDRNLAQTVSAAKPAVVYIVVQTPTGAQSGSGFVLASDADKSTIVTANHVIEGGSEVDVIFDSDEKERYQAQVIKHDHEKDVAVLQVTIGNRPALHLAKAESVQEGESIVLIGYPEATLDFRRIDGDSLRPSVHAGIVSAIRLNGEIIQFDAATFHGDSGAPIVDAATGEVVAIVRGMLGDPRFSSVGLEQGLPGSTYGPSTARIASVVGSPADAAVSPSNQSSPSPIAVVPTVAASPHAIQANSASYRVGYGVPHNSSFTGSADAVNEINTALEVSALDRLTRFLKSDNSLYLIPVSLNPEMANKSQLLSGYCDDNRLNAVVFPIIGWQLNGGPRYNTYGRLIGYDGNASVSIAFYAEDCYGSVFFGDRKEKSENRRFVHRTPDREVVDMVNDLLDHLMQEFADERTAHQAAWNSLLKTGIAIDPNDTGLHTLFSYIKKPEGYQVVVVVPDGPADHAGVKVLDMIVRVNNVDAATLSREDITRMTNASSYTMDLQRPGGIVTVTVHPQGYADLVNVLQH